MKLKNKILNGLWLVIGLFILTLFIAAVQKRKNNNCHGLKIEISNNNQTNFITEKEINEVVNPSGVINSKPIKKIDLQSLEKALQKNLWVKNAELYIDNKNILHVDIAQRQPISRIFTVNGGSNYLDNNALRLPIKQNANARVLVITNFPSDNEILSHGDSLLLIEVKNISNYIYADSFWNAQIAQINISTSGNFELIPNLGNHIINFGNADDIKEKFNKLYTFYSKAWLQLGINKYNLLDVRFKDQVVASNFKENLPISDSSILK